MGGRLRRRLPHFLLACVSAALALRLGSSAGHGRAARAVHRSTYVPAGDLRLRTVRAGSGRSVLLLHGYGESLISWRGIFDQLARHADVAALDLPAFGLSSKPPTGYATDSLARDVLKAMDALGIGQAVLVGHSLGGAIAAAVAVQAPLRVSGLVLIDPAIALSRGTAAARYPGGVGPEGLRMAIAEYEMLRPRFSPPHDSNWLSESAGDLAYSPATDGMYRVALQSVLREFDFDYLDSAKAAGIRQPALVIWGEYDRLAPLSLGETLVRMLPNARLVVIPRSWHRPHVERPREVGDIIVQFLDTL